MLLRLLKDEGPVGVIVSSLAWRVFIMFVNGLFLICYKCYDLPTNRSDRRALSFVGLVFTEKECIQKKSFAEYRLLLLLCALITD